MPNAAQIPRILLLIETSRAYGRGIVEGVARYAEENGPWSIQFEERALDSQPPAWLAQWRGDGIIVRTDSMKLEKLLRATRKPLIELHGNPEIGIAQVRTDGTMGGRMVVEHFLDCGLQHFAYFSCEEAWWIDENRDLFCKALEAVGGHCHIFHPLSAKRSQMGWNDRQRMRVIEWLRSLPKPIGIYTAGDLYAARLLDACRAAEIAVPEEVAIVGIGNDPVICETVRPTLSSLDLNAQRIGYEAAGLLHRKILGEPAQDTIFVPPSRLVVRQSTNIMVIEDADVAEAMRFIQKNACANIDVSDVAERVGLSRRVLERRFRRYRGRTPLAEIQRYRIEHAKKLLAQTDLSFESVARRSGLASAEYLMKVFRNHIGMTPNAYRRLHRLSRDPKKL
jgi:LacI family transcriptional regulator